MSGTNDPVPERSDRRLRKQERLRFGSEFRQLRHKGRRIAGRWMVLYVIDSPVATGEYDASGRTTRQPLGRVGILVSRKLGNAVTRNRVRRLMREAWRLNKQKLITPLHVMMVARAGIRERSLQEIERELLELMEAANAIPPRTRD